MSEYFQKYYKDNKDKWLGEEGYNNQEKYRDYRKEWYQNKCENVVYLFFNQDNEIIRIGSTNNLYFRMNNYFNGNFFNYGLYKWFNEIGLDKVLYINIDTREKAYALESVLIKKYNPILNQQQVKTDYWDKYNDALGDLENIEELFLEYDISKYKELF